MHPTLLHVLSQRPSLTGSGITLDALGGHAAGTWRQHAVVGVPAEEPATNLAGLTSQSTHPLAFGEPPLDFRVPGMSDVMPYPSTVFSQMTGSQLAAYREGWRRHLGRVLDGVRPDLIHAHHLWILGSMIKDLAPDTPLVLHCHATGLRQAVLCPHLAKEVRLGCARADRFVVLHGDHATDLADALGVDPKRIHVVGAGYREDLFHARGRTPDVGANLVYVGKYSHAKGLPWLLDALESLAVGHPSVTLHVAGSGAGPEADALRQRMKALSPRVVLHGQLSQAQLADLLRRCRVCVLPSLYEGVPLVLAEALACGCHLVSTRLPGVVNQLAPHLGPWLELVDLPPMRTIDTPEPNHTEAFAQRLTQSLDAALSMPSARPPPDALAPFTWKAVFERVEAVWWDLL
jgi:alpha-maltose-1-phosphate synthase